MLKIDYGAVTKYPNKESKRGSNSLIKGGKLLYCL
jgi:hypothetical protein